MGALAAVCLAIPGSWNMVEATTGRGAAHPVPYLLGLAGLLIFFAYWSFRHSYPPGRQVPWVLYLLFISVVEEFIFRLVLPSVLFGFVPTVVALVLSNLVFASIHYVTLRWRLVNCIATFLGGMGLSHLMAQGDLLLVIMVHWLGTFINTPSPPSKQSDGAG
jgi:membrane protease YdiL (CAAX protease family)